MRKRSFAFRKIDFLLRFRVFHQTHRENQTGIFLRQPSRTMIITIDDMRIFFTTHNWWVLLVIFERKKFNNFFLTATSSNAFGTVFTICRYNEFFFTCVAFLCKRCRGCVNLSAIKIFLAVENINFCVA